MNSEQRLTAAALPVGADTSGRRLSPGLQAVHDDANRCACTHCGRPVGERCVWPGTDRLTRIPHLVRLLAPRPVRSPA